MTKNSKYLRRSVLTTNKGKIIRLAVLIKSNWKKNPIGKKYVIHGKDALKIHKREAKKKPFIHLDQLTVY